MMFFSSKPLFPVHENVYDICYEPGVTRKQTSNKLKIIAKINTQRKNYYNLDKLFYKQISNNIFFSQEKVPRKFSNSISKVFFI